MSTEETKKLLAVIKVGGDVLLDEAEKSGLGDNIASLIDAGWQVCLLHGGGPQTSMLQEKCGITPRKVAGRRITSEEDLTVVKQAVCGQVNVELVSALQGKGINAFGCHGVSGQLIQAVKRPPRVFSGAGDKPIDFGEVGDVTGVNTALLKLLLDNSLVPVIASMGAANDGRPFNINADTTVIEISKAMSSDLLLLTTGVGAVFQDINNPSSRIKEVNKVIAKDLIDSGVITDGMIPKVEEALSLLEFGVKSISIAKAGECGAFLSIANGQNKYGTRITL